MEHHSIHCQAGLLLLIELLLSESLEVVDRLSKAPDEEIRKINLIEVAEKKKEIKHQYVNYQLSEEIRTTQD